MKKWMIIFIGIPLALSCSKEEESVSDSLTEYPSIAFVSIDPSEVDNFNNSITLTIKYKDNNGDLGYEDPDEYALSVKDSRLDSADYYHVPPLAPVGKNLIIEGQLEIVLNSMFILGNGSSELVSLDVKIKDRAGHWSNTITTPPITINR